MTAFRLATPCVICAAAALLLAPAVQAQQVYRIVGPDGKVTFSDRAPEANAQGAQAGSALRSGGGVETDALPYALRQVVTRYPVTLYTGSDCTPCASARALLMRRGVPFAERTVNTADDIEALKRLAGEAALPFATIGTQQLKGFADVEWDQYLDAAGYPRQSQLPANYRRAPATPLVAVVARPTEPAAPAAQAPAAARQAPQRPAAQPGTTRNPANPAGIVF